MKRAKDTNLPPEPGTTPIPDDHVRLYHQTDERNLGRIKREGIRLSHAKGIEGPKAIYADTKGFYGKPSETPTVEFSVHKDHWKSPFVLRDVEPKDIIAIHKRWHSHARYAENDSEIKKALVAGEHDDILKNEKGNDVKGYKYVKKKYS